MTSGIDLAIERINDSIVKLRESGGSDSDILALVQNRNRLLTEAGGSPAFRDPVQSEYRALVQTPMMKFVGWSPDAIAPWTMSFGDSVSRGIYDNVIKPMYGTNEQTSGWIEEQVNNFVDRNAQDIAWKGAGGVIGMAGMLVVGFLGYKYAKKQGLI